MGYGASPGTARAPRAPSSSEMGAAASPRFGESRTLRFPTRCWEPSLWSKARLCPFSAGRRGNWEHGARFGPQAEPSNELLQVRNCLSSKPQCFPPPFWFPVPVALAWGQPSASHPLLGAFR